MKRSKFNVRKIKSKLPHLNAIQGVKERKPEAYDIYGEGLSDADNTEVRQMRKFCRGFTLVETLVAIFILSMSITSAMTVASSGLRATFYAKDRIAAYFLAQEAIEIVKNKRDENGIKNYQAVPPIHWLKEITVSQGGPCGEGDDTCGADSSGDILVNCDDYENCLLYQDPADGIFKHVPDGGGGGLEETKFTRVINMEEINNDEAKVTVTVSWPGRDFTVTEHILNWHPLSECLSPNCP